MSKARYIMGPNTVSRLQLPSTDGETEVVAGKRIDREECLRYGNKVRAKIQNQLKMPAAAGPH